MKNRGTLNLVIDAVMFLGLAFIAGIGFLMKYTLPPGREKILKYGENAQLYFLGLDRHQWGSIHLIAAYVMLGLLVLHIALHWKTIVGLVRNAVPLPLLRSTLTAILVLLGAVCFTFAFFVAPTRTDHGDYLFRNQRGRMSARRKAGYASAGRDWPVKPGNHPSLARWREARQPFAAA